MYVHPNRTEIESGNAGKVLKSIEKDFDMFVGAEFENIVKDQFKSRDLGVNCHSHLTDLAGSGGR